MADILPVLNEINCGKHCDLACFIGAEATVRWMASAARQLTDAQIVAIMDATCCAKTCAIKVAPRANEMADLMLGFK